MASTTGQGFSIGISAEQQLSMPLDSIIKQAKKAAPKAKKPVPVKLKQHNVKKTVVVPVSKAARARVNTAAASTKRQAVMNTRRKGLVVTKVSKKRAPPKVQTRRLASANGRVTRSMAAGGKHKRAQKQAGGLDVSNIINHFRTHPKKFDVPKGSNLRITINLHNVKPVVGSKK